MDAQQFLAEFGHIANAPGGVGKLRELVLAFAVQGALVPQDATDESATGWLSRMAVMKSDLLKQKKIAKQTAFVDIPEHEHPYSLPLGWAFARLGAITNKIGSGSTPRGGREVYVRTGVPFLRSQNIWNDGIRLDDVAFITQTVHENMEGSAVKGNDILLNITGASLGRCALVPTDFGDANVSQHVTIIRPTDSAIRAYLHLCMLSPYTQAMIWARQVGMAREGLSKKVLEQFEIPLPPVNEQSRIVSKVDELMALCDQLEAQQQQRRSLQNKLRQSTLQAIAAATSPHELQTTWARLADNFGQLFHEPEDVTELRGLILDLAVHGLLVSQDSSDELIADWLFKIATRKAELAKSKLIAKQPAQVDIPEGEHPFLLPRGWVFVRLGTIADKIGSGSTPRGGREVYVKEGVPFLRSQNVWNDGLRLHDVAFITHAEHERMGGTAVQGNDLLLNITGASLGRCALVPSDFGEANVSQHVTIIRPTDPQIRAYLHLAMLSPYTQSMIWGRQVGMAREGLSKKVLEQFEMPLPPIPEQHRIIQRVAELMRFCDTMEIQLRASVELAARFAATAVANITGIDATSEKDTPLKAPQTELIAPLRLGQTPDIKAQAPLATILARHQGELAAKDLWQRFGGEIDAFYAQLKQEVAHGWIQQPEVAEMREKAAS